MVNKGTINDGTVDDKVLHWETVDWEEVGNCIGLYTRKLLMLMVSYVILHYVGVELKFRQPNFVNLPMKLLIDVKFCNMKQN